MPFKLKLYIGSVIAAGSLAGVLAATHWNCDHPAWLLAALATALLASFAKLRLPGITGTYSLNFLFALIGVCAFSLPETILLLMAGALAQSLWFAKKRPTLVQIAFNMANLTLAVTACFAVTQGPFASQMSANRSAVLALAAATYFVVNTVMVSGVLSLIEGKPLREVCRQWYLWSFPYYLAGAALVGLLPLGGNHAPPVAWLILLPLAYLLHFFCGLQRALSSVAGTKHAESGRLPGKAQVYIAAVSIAGLLLLIWSITSWQSVDALRFGIFLVFSALASTCKIPLPGVTGTVSLGFVAVLINIAELSVGEAIMISALMPVLQCVWNAKKKIQPLQVGLSTAALLISTAAAFFVSRLVPGGVSGNLALALAITTGVLYLSNTVLVSSAMALAASRPWSSIWQSCYYYSFPYYLAGAAGAALMISTARETGWGWSFLFVPIIVLMYVSYRQQITQKPAAA